MRCSQLENRLNELLDRREDPSTDAEIAAHTAACRRCRRVAAAYIATAEGAAALAEDPNFGATVYEAVVPASRRFGVLRATTAGVWAVAAALLLYFTAAPQTNEVAVVATTHVTGDSIAQTATPFRAAPAMVDLSRSAGRMYVDLFHDTARGVDGAFSLAASVPPADELLEPVLFADGGLLKQINDEWLPAAGATLDVIEQSFTDEPQIRS